MGVSELLDHLSEQTKRLLDNASLGLAGLSGAITYTNIMATLNMAAVLVAILSGLASLGWTLWRWRRDRSSGSKSE